MPQPSADGVLLACALNEASEALLMAGAANARPCCLAKKKVDVA
jgi:hypothetical protein